MSAKVVDKKEKRELILNAAVREFTKKGFPRTTINDIAKAAGIGKGTIYEYFPNKEAIIQDTFSYFMRLMEPDFEAILIAKIPATQKLKQLIDGLSQYINQEYSEGMELMFEFWSEGIKDKKSKGILYGEMIRFYHIYREIFADIIIEGMSDGSFRKDINPHSISAMIVGALDGLLFQWILEHESLNFQDILRTITDTVLNGISLIKR